VELIFFVIGQRRGLMYVILLILVSVAESLGTKVKGHGFVYFVVFDGTIDLP